jgi:hypothetical protein
VLRGIRAEELMIWIMGAGWWLLCKVEQLTIQPQLSNPLRLSSQASAFKCVTPLHSKTSRKVRQLTDKHMGHFITDLDWSPYLLSPLQSPSELKPSL